MGENKFGSVSSKIKALSSFSRAKYYVFRYYVGMSKQYTSISLISSQIWQVFTVATRIRIDVTTNLSVQCDIGKLIIINIFSHLYVGHHHTLASIFFFLFRGKLTRHNVVQLNNKYIFISCFLCTIL